MAITLGNTYNLSKDGTNFLTCPTSPSEGDSVTVAALYQSFNSSAANQLWTVTGTDLASCQLTCNIGTTTWYITADGAMDDPFTITSSTPSTTLNIAADGTSIILNGYDPRVYLTQDSSNSIVQGTAAQTWKFITPYLALATGVIYNLITTEGYYLSTEDTNGSNAEVANHLHGDDSNFNITGDGPTNGVISNAQVSSLTGFYITGTKSDENVVCNNPLNADYKWTITDDGFGNATFLSIHIPDNHDEGYLLGSSPNPMIQVTAGRPAQKWKFVKANIIKPA